MLSLYCGSSYFVSCFALLSTYVVLIVPLFRRHFSALFLSEGRVSVFGAHPFEIQSVDEMLHFRQCPLPHGRLQLAFPNCHHVPAHRLERSVVFFVARPVALNLPAPEFRVRLWQMRVLMPVPETAVDEDDDAVFAHYDVGSARQPSAVFAVAVAPGEEIAAHNHLRFRILAADMRHTAVACLSVEDIHLCLFNDSPAKIRNDWDMDKLFLKVSRKISNFKKHFRML